MTYSNKALLLAATAVAVLIHAPANAQTTTASKSPEVEEVVVTGSHVIKDGNAAPQPLTVLTSQELLARAPNSVADALIQLPQFRGNLTANGVIGFANGARSGNYLNLRNLGQNRVLITLDGVRVPPTDRSGGVDINTLPQALIERVDVVTGGASAAYGSDAVAGVVNFVLNKHFTGIKGSVQAGKSKYGDAGSNKQTIAGGVSLLDDRLHLVGSAEHTLAYGFDVDDRPFGKVRYGTAGAGSVANPFISIPNATYNQATPGGLIIGGPLAGMAFGRDGTLHRADLGILPVPGSIISIGGEGAPGYLGATAAGYSRNDQVFARVGYDVTPAIEAYAQVGWAESRDKNHAINNIRFPNGPAQLTIFRDNAYIPAPVLAGLGAAQSFVLGRALYEQGVGESVFTNDSINYRVGFDGKIADRWTWSANFGQGTAILRVNAGDMDNRKLYASIDAARDPTGAIVCRVTITNPGLYPGCVPSNLFGEGSMSPAAVAYTLGTSQFRIRNRLSIASANISGDLFELPAGPVAVAIGGEWRQQSLLTTSNSDPAFPFDRTGLRGVPAAALTYRLTNSGVASGEAKVKEAFAEVAVPLLKDKPWAQALDVTGAARITDYSTSGTVETWKGGVSYQPIEDIRFRGTISRDIRAPTLNELYAGKQAQPQNLLDPHTNTQTAFFAISQGNPNLRPEKANTLVGGVVLRPQMIPGLSISVDYYRIKITDVITTIANTTAVVQCEASNGTSPICANIVRPLPFSDRSPANAYTAVFNQPLNLAVLKQQGLDYEASYNLAAFDGELRFRLFGNILFHQKSQDTPGAPILESAGCCGNPKYTGTASLDYVRGPVQVGVVTRGFSGFDRSNQLAYKNYGHEPPMLYFDLHGSYDFGPNKRYQAFANIQNLFNMSPATLPINNTNINLTPPTDVGFYDMRGAYFTGGLRFKF